MRTSNLLPEECKAEIRERIEYWKDTEPRLAKLCDADGRLAELEWVLTLIDKEG